MQMRARLDLNRERIGACLGKGGQKRIGIDDHEMDVDWQRRHFAKARQNGYADRYIGHKCAIHDVEMKPVGFRRLEAANFVG